MNDTPTYMAAQQHDDDFARAIEQYSRMFDEITRRAEFLTGEFHQFLLLLEETVKACNAPWGDDHKAEEILNFITPYNMPDKFKLLVLLVRAKNGGR